MPDNPEWQPQAWGDDVGLRVDGPMLRFFIIAISFCIAVTVGYLAFRSLSDDGTTRNPLPNATSVFRNEASAAAGTETTP